MSRCPVLLPLLVLLAGGPFAPRALGEEKFDSTITIYDAKGRVSQSATPSLNSVTVDVKVGPGFVFNPDFVTIVAGDTIRWTWFGSNHTVTSGPSFCVADNAYCSPNNINCPTAIVSNNGAVYSHTFSEPGTYSYFCRVHCGAGMTGSLTVLSPFVMVTTTIHTPTGHFILQGQTIANRTVTVQASPDLVSEFIAIGTATADESGSFQFDDGSDPTRLTRFYRAIF